MDIDIIPMLPFEIAGKYLWLIQIAIVIFLTIAVNLTQIFILRYLQKPLTADKWIWHQSVVEGISRPLTILIWVLGTAFCIDILYVKFVSSVYETDFSLEMVRTIAIIAAITWFAYRTVKIYRREYIKLKTDAGIVYDASLVDITSKISVITIIVLGALAVMQALDVNVAGILAFGGVGGIAVAFAAKDLIASYFGGLMLHLDQPFKVGDNVSSFDMEIKGTIESIGWRQVIIRRFDTRLLYVPNSAFSTISVLNRRRKTNRLIDEYVGIRYDDAQQIKPIVDEIRQMLLNHDGLDEVRMGNRWPAVHFVRFAPSSLDIRIYCYTKDTSWNGWLATKEDVLIKTMDIVVANNAEVAFPTSTIHLFNQSNTDPEMQSPATENNDVSG